jgi:hypothetical protein
LGAKVCVFVLILEGAGFWKGMGMDRYPGWALVVWLAQMLQDLHLGLLDMVNNKRSISVKLCC